MKKIYTSIDIGTYSIKIIVGEYINNKIHILASTCVQSKGIKKGLITEASNVIESIKNGIKEIKELLGFPIKKVIVNIPDYNARFKTVYATLNVSDLNRFEEGTTVTPELLIETGMIKKPLNGIKILGNGELTKKLTVKSNAFSKTAKEKIENVGGKTEVI